MSIRSKLQDWCRGRYVEPPESRRDDPIVFISAGYYEPTPAAKVICGLCAWVGKHWAGAISTIVIGVVIGTIVLLIGRWLPEPEASPLKLPKLQVLTIWNPIIRPTINWICVMLPIVSALCPGDCRSF